MVLLLATGYVCHTSTKHSNGNRNCNRTQLMNCQCPVSSSIGYHRKELVALNTPVQ